MQTSPAAESAAVLPPASSELPGADDMQTSPAAEPAAAAAVPLPASSPPAETSQHDSPAINGTKLDSSQPVAIPVIPSHDDGSAQAQESKVDPNAGKMSSGQSDRVTSALDSGTREERSAGPRDLAALVPDSALDSGAGEEHSAGVRGHAAPASDSALDSCAGEGRSAGLRGLEAQAKAAQLAADIGVPPGESAASAEIRSASEAPAARDLNLKALPAENAQAALKTHSKERDPLRPEPAQSELGQDPFRDGSADPHPSQPISVMPGSSKLDACRDCTSDLHLVQPASSPLDPPSSTALVSSVGKGVELGGADGNSHRPEADVSALLGVAQLDPSKFVAPTSLLEPRVEPPAAAGDQSKADASSACTEAPQQVSLKIEASTEMLKAIVKSYSGAGNLHKADASSACPEPSQQEPLKAAGSDMVKGLVEPCAADGNLREANAVSAQSDPCQEGPSGIAASAGMMAVPPEPLAADGHTLVAKALSAYPGSLQQEQLNYTNPDTVETTLEPPGNLPEANQGSAHLHLPQQDVLGTADADLMAALDKPPVPDGNPSQAYASSADPDLSKRHSPDSKAPLDMVQADEPDLVPLVQALVEPPAAGGHPPGANASSAHPAASRQDAAERAAPPAAMPQGDMERHLQKVSEAATQPQASRQNAHDSTTPMELDSAASCRPPEGIQQEACDASIRPDASSRAVAVKACASSLDKTMASGAFENDARGSSKQTGLAASTQAQTSCQPCASDPHESMASRPSPTDETDVGKHGGDVRPTLAAHPSLQDWIPPTLNRHPSLQDRIPPTLTNHPSLRDWIPPTLNGHPSLSDWAQRSVGDSVDTHIDAGPADVATSAADGTSSREGAAGVDVQREPIDLHADQQGGAWQENGCRQQGEGGLQADRQGSHPAEDEGDVCHADMHDVRDGGSALPSDPAQDRCPARDRGDGALADMHDIKDEVFIPADGPTQPMHPARDAGDSLPADRDHMGEEGASADGGQSRVGAASLHEHGRDVPRYDPLPALVFRIPTLSIFIFLSNVDINNNNDNEGIQISRLWC